MSSGSTAREKPSVDVSPADRIVGQSQVASWGGSSSVGLARSCNEDCYGREGTLFVVADGIGGVAGGAAAASTAVGQVLRRARHLDVGAELQEWSGMIRSMSESLRHAMSDLGCDGAGTTLTLALVEPDRVVAAHVGDSRLYELVAGELRQWTVDHNLRTEMSSLGLEPIEVERRGLRLDALVSYIGCADPALRVDAFSWQPASGTRLLLCTDGVHGALAEAEIAGVVAGLPPLEAARQLTRLAELAGGRDNATAVVVEL